MTQQPLSTQRDPVYLRDILQSAYQARSYVADLELSVFQQDVKTQDAVLRRITIIGEAARRVSETFKQAHPELPWREMLGMRNLVVHEYTRVRAIRVWEVVLRDLPVLIEQIESLLEPPDSND